MDYKDIVREAAARKLIDLSRFFLDTIDELKSEDASRVNKFEEILSGVLDEKQVNLISPFLSLIDDSKKDLLRKRILDRTNELKRELTQ